jgi:Na+/H+-dicarboxylate symporter
MTGLGKGANLNIEGVNADTFAGVTRSFSDVLIGFFPTNFLYDISNNKIIPVIIFSVIIAVAYVLIADKNKNVHIFKKFVDALKDIVFKAVDFIIVLTPYAVIALTAVATSKGIQNGKMLLSLLFFLVLGYVAFIIDSFGINAVLLKAFANVNPLHFFKKSITPFITAFTTQSSVGTLGVSIPTARDKLGVSEEVADFVLPLGTTIGMPGCAGIWPVLTAVYGVFGLGIDYSLTDWLLLGIMALFVSIGTAGVPGTATIVTASVLTAVGLPLEVMVLTIPISSIADMGRTATNVAGAMTSAVIVSHEEKNFNREIYNSKNEKTIDKIDKSPAPSISDELKGESCKI